MSKTKEDLEKLRKEVNSFNCNVEPTIKSYEKLSGILLKAVSFFNEYVINLEKQKKEMVKYLMESVKHDMDERGCSQPFYCNHETGQLCEKDCYTFKRILFIKKIAGKSIEEIINE